MTKELRSQNTELRMWNKTAENRLFTPSKSSGQVLIIELNKTE
jgi:hypothetical protein